MATKQEERRLHLVLSKTDFEKIEAIKKHYGLNSMREAVRRAISVLNIIVEEDATLCAKDEDTKIVLV